MKRASLCTAMRRQYNIRGVFYRCPRRKRSLLEAVVEEQARRCATVSSVFVAHVREPEGLAFDFAVAPVDDEMVFFAQVAREFGDVDAAIVSHAGEGNRAKAFFGEKVETALAHPIVDESDSFADVRA